MSDINNTGLFPKHIYTNSNKLDSLPIEDGQIIVLTDSNRLCYDKDGIRHIVPDDKKESVVNWVDQDITKFTKATSVEFVNLDPLPTYELFAETSDGSLIKIIDSQTTRKTVDSKEVIDIKYTFEPITLSQSPANFRLLSIDSLPSPEFKIVTWADGTDLEIETMLNAHYAGGIDIANFWSVGDRRRVYLSSMSATYVPESHAAQYVDLVIIGINHDNLADGSGKAAITVQQLNPLIEKGQIDDYFSGERADYFPNTNRYNWLQNVYFNSIPNGLSRNIKSVSKYFYKYSTNSNLLVNTKCFLLNACEVMDSSELTTKYPNLNIIISGIKYSYYNNKTNIAKYINGVSVGWFFSTPIKISHPNIIYIHGQNNTCYAVWYYSEMGICPAFCL